MSRSRTNTHDSLDLLLDTICNTFGGVLFISLLVVILLNMTSKTVSFEPPPVASQEELVRQEERVREQQSRLETLSRAVEQRERAIEQFSDSDARALAEEQRRRQSEFDDLLGERNRRVRDIASSQEEINETLQEMQNVREELAAAEARHAELAAQLAQEIEERSQTAELPKQHGTSKAPVVFLLKERRLCAYTAVGPGGEFMPNERETRVQSDADGEYVEAILSNGLLVDRDGGNVEEIQNRLNEFDSAAHFILVAVWTDSFEEAAVVRDAAVRSGFEYTLRPFPEEERLRFGGSDQPIHVQ